MRTRTVLFVLALAALGIPAAASADISPWLLAPGEQATSIEGGFYSSDTYHDADGNRAYLAGGGLAEQRSLTWTSQFGWKKWANFRAAIPFVSATRRFGGNGQPTLPTTAGLGDALVSLLIPVWKGSGAAAVEITWKGPLGYDRSFLFESENDVINVNEARQLSTPSLGEGQHDFTGMFRLGSGLGARGFWQAGAGYTYRDLAPSDRIELSGDLGLWFTKSILLAGRYRGGIAAEGENLTRDASYHLAGATLLYRVDDHLDVFIGSMHTAAAENALHTDQITVGLTTKSAKLNRSQGYLGNSTKP
ncbi:MAG: hypothetical protein HOP12_12160 [Candidatus Eisenbacteria bacterium]|uniref:Transporter n=1 Tax=Eiseniibacteriota bacterium TaxID=2212470 RepID=A0A849SGN5_UNCEI|nr:hypothetical protein [Candidatus Eisenbacteria bacterium]